ncbi:RHS repeat-associated core domain-containing protein [Chryseobacterium sp. 3008163]|uniref:RHS repeat-associated core domain-containing protein n=1 Tax=Chryseobacterium sp. 3008163 TaxID=2478663 RepID=UPI001E546235|nr:RHS repeat-associated core domain-containing protein [Chryseobacterium sp. 3008163]
MDWRHYMPDIGRFAAMDPLAGVIPSWTPYRFTFNNPVYFSDPSGLLERGPEMLSDWIKNLSTGEYKFDKNVTGYGDTPLGYEYVGPTGSYTNASGDVVNLLANGEKETQIQEVSVIGKKGGSGALDYLNFLNDRAGDTSDVLASRRWQGGSFRVFSNRNVSLQGFSPLYRADNFGARGLTRSRYYNVSKTLKKGSVIASVTLGVIEVGNGVAEAGVSAGAVIGVWFGGVGAGPGALVGGIIGGVLGSWGGSELGEAGVEKAYE